MKLYEVIRVIFKNKDDKTFAGKAEFKDTEEAANFFKNFDKKNFSYEIVKEFQKEKKNNIKREKTYKPTKEDKQKAKEYFKKVRNQFKKEIG